jgi:hypothetical protein
MKGSSCLPFQGEMAGLSVPALRCPNLASRHGKKALIQSHYLAMVI